jgi:hypothetical protein
LDEYRNRLLTSVENPVWLVNRGNEKCFSSQISQAFNPEDGIYKESHNVGRLPTSDVA